MTYFSFNQASECRIRRRFFNVTSGAGWLAGSNSLDFPTPLYSFLLSRSSYFFSCRISRPILYSEPVCIYRRSRLASLCLLAKTRRQSEGRENGRVRSERSDRRAEMRAPPGGQSDPLYPPPHRAIRTPQSPRRDISPGPPVHPRTFPYSTHRAKYS